MIDKLIEQQETIKGMQENEENAIKIMKMYEDYKLRVDKAIEFIEEHNIIGTNKEYLPSGIEKCYSLELMEILKGDEK